MLSRFVAVRLANPRKHHDCSAVAYEISVDEARWYGSFIGLQPILDTLRLGGLYAGIGMLFVGGSGFASWGMVRLRPASSRLCQVGEPS